MNLPSIEAVVVFFILMFSVPVVFVFWFTIEAKDNSPRKGLRNPKIAIPVGIFFLYLSGVISDPFTFLSNPFFNLVLNPLSILGFGFTSIGVIALYKKYKDGVVQRY